MNRGESRVYVVSDEDHDEVVEEAEADEGHRVVDETNSQLRETGLSEVSIQIWEKRKLLIILRFYPSTTKTWYRITYLTP